MYRLRILQGAMRDLERLDRSTARRIAKRADWRAANLDNIRPQPLTANLVGYFKFRIGDYRIVYEILHDENVIVIHQIEHRREIYRKR